MALFSSFWGCFVLHIKDVCRSVFLQGFATFYASDQNSHCIHRGHVERESKLIVYLPDFLASTLPSSAGVSQLECMPQDFDCFVRVHWFALTSCAFCSAASRIASLRFEAGLECTTLVAMSSQSIKFSWSSVTPRSTSMQAKAAPRRDVYQSTQMTLPLGVCTLYEVYCRYAV